MFRCNGEKIAKSLKKRGGRTIQRKVGLELGERKPGLSRGGRQGEQGGPTAWGLHLTCADLEGREMEDDASVTARGVKPEGG